MKTPAYTITITTESRSVYETLMDTLDETRLTPAPSITVSKREGIA